MHFRKNGYSPFLGNTFFSDVAKPTGDVPDCFMKINKEKPLINYPSKDTLLTNYFKDCFGWFFSPKSLHLSFFCQNSI